MRTTRWGRSPRGERARVCCTIALVGTQVPVGSALRPLDFDLLASTCNESGKETLSQWVRLDAWSVNLL
jgi:hypothetical protein